MTETVSVTDKTLRAWLSAGAVDRGVGDGLTFTSSATSALHGKASWVFRYRLGRANKEKTLGRYPELSLKAARELCRINRSNVQQGVDVAALKRLEKIKACEYRNVSELALAWYQRHIAESYKHPQVVLRVIKRHIDPVLGTLPLRVVRPVHIDRLLTDIVNSGAPTVANDVMRYLFRMFHFAVKRELVGTNPVAGFELSDAGGTETPRRRWLDEKELATLAHAMRTTVTFGRQNELPVWLLLALCVRKMELLSAKWSEFDLDRGVWSLTSNRTKTAAQIEIPLAPQVLKWLREVQIFADGSEYLFPARRRMHMKMGIARRNRFEHISPDTLNVALKRLKMSEIEHFTVHDMRRTARTHLARLGVDRFVAERALNHKLRGVEGIYDQFDYFAERKSALEQWATVLEGVVRHERKQSDWAQAKSLQRRSGTGTQRQIQKEAAGTADHRTPRI